MNNLNLVESSLNLIRASLPQPRPTVLSSIWSIASSSACSKVSLLLLLLCESELLLCESSCLMWASAGVPPCGFAFRYVRAVDKPDASVDDGAAEWRRNWLNSCSSTTCVTRLPWKASV